MVHAARRALGRLPHALVLMLACGGDDSGDTGSTGNADTTCGTPPCNGTNATAATTDTTAPADESSTAITSAEDSTTLPPGDSSSTAAPDVCASDTCSACFECTYDNTCMQAQSLCAVDPACSIALICVRDCIQQDPDPATCVAACQCPADGPFQDLMACATGVCVPNGSCPALGC